MVGGKTGHPLPQSEEARHDEIPEQLEREKGEGEDGKAAARPTECAVNPDGEPYRPGSSAFQRDQRDHQRRGQDDIESDR